MKQEPLWGVYPQLREHFRVLQVKQKLANLPESTFTSSYVGKLHSRSFNLEIWRGGGGREGEEEVREGGDLRNNHHGHDDLPKKGISNAARKQGQR
jgi:hypothetical protein